MPQDNERLIHKLDRLTQATMLAMDVAAVASAPVNPVGAAIGLASLSYSLGTKIREKIDQKHALEQGFSPQQAEKIATGQISAPTPTGNVVHVNPQQSERSSFPDPSAQSQTGGSVTPSQLHPQKDTIGDYTWAIGSIAKDLTTGLGKLLLDFTLVGNAIKGASALASAPREFADTATRGVRSVNRWMDNPEQLTQEGKRQGGFRGMAKELGGGFLSAIRPDPFAPAGADEFKRANDFLMGGGAAKFVPIVGETIKSFTKLGHELFETTDRLRNWGDKLHESNMRFTDFSGAMAGVQARQEVRDIRLSRDRGDRRAESAEYLNEGRDRLRRDLSKYEDAIGNLSNKVVGWLSKNAAEYFTSPITKKLEEWGILDKDLRDKGSEEMKEFREMADDLWASRHGRPGRFNRWTDDPKRP